MARAHAASRGAPLPRSGSFQDELLQEVDTRERNLKMTEMWIYLSVAERIIELLVRMHYNDKDSVKIDAIDRQTSQEYLKAFESELFQERYLPEYVAKIREASRRKKEALASSDAAAAAAVADFSED